MKNNYKILYQNLKKGYFHSLALAVIGGQQRNRQQTEKFSTEKYDTRKQFGKTKLNS